ncbi:Gfo/Idh/MocA family protein [Paenibacillus cymbidii]|uniref:Gfo/Idh/MocA family protein n=1 Tax=Paenibacillus cymbidii TaxID=1639034 RepID=UPI001F32730B|nr:Gfo/Idh/MocA family oxidoreductase [Paenibacillus cymbidii]
MGEWWLWPTLSPDERMMKMNLGVIGYGLRIKGMVQAIIANEPACRLTAIVDPRQDEIRNQLNEKERNAVRFYSTPEEMLESAELDGVLIGTRCSLHTQMALKVLPTGIPLFLEKPVATTMEDLLQLKRGWETARSPVLVSFPLSLSKLVLLSKEIVDSGKIGTVEHVQAVNNVPYGGVYFHAWYRDENETGGLFLQKATHDFDYITSILQLKPVSICAMTSKQIFTGTKPAGLKCVDCSENKTCEESTAFSSPQTRQNWAYCCFAEDTGNEDSGSALIRYESGMHVNYSQNFFVRRTAEARGARFMGYKGTLAFDFYTNRIQVHMHHTPRVETYQLDQEEDHAGGDAALAKNFVEMIRDGKPPVRTLDDGLLSALMCLKAKESSLNGQFCQVAWQQPARS